MSGKFVFITWLRKRASAREMRKTSASRRYSTSAAARCHVVLDSKNWFPGGRKWFYGNGHACNLLCLNLYKHIVVLVAYFALFTDHLEPVWTMVGTVSSRARHAGWHMMTKPPHTSSCLPFTILYLFLLKSTYLPFRNISYHVREAYESHLMPRDGSVSGNQWLWFIRFIMAML